MGAMTRAIVGIAPILGLILILVWWVGQRALEPERRPVAVVAEPERHPVAVAAEPGAVPSTTPAPLDVVDSEEDRLIFREKMEWARAERLDTLPIGEIVARVALAFVGAPYTPGTLEIEGPERLVVNLREFDCVTLVESTLAMARLIRDGRFDDYDGFTRELARIRYRGGVIDGYASRLHYFSDWIADGESKGIVRNVTRELGGIPDTGRVNFMSTHPEAYRQLADPANLEAIRGVEAELGRRPRHYIPEHAIEGAAGGIRNGDIIAATSSLPGLDVAHTGFALWLDGRLHLLHAPLVGKTVEISELPLAGRIQRIEGQDGIMVARPS
jgi:hypothetical protein